MQRKTLALVLLLLVLGTFGLTQPSPTQAQPSDNLLQELPVSGPLSDGGTFAGTLSVTGISLDPQNQLLLTGLLNGTATRADSSTQAIQNQPFSQAVDLSPNQACDILTLDLGPLNLELLGLTVDLAPVNLEINAVPGPGNLLGNLLCAIAGLLDAPDITTALNGLLGQVNALLGGVLTQLPVSGPLSDGGTFQGTLTPNQMSLTESGALQVTGLLNGTATTNDSQTQQIVNQPFTTTAALLTGAPLLPPVCDILQLDLGPLNLDLLGLTVDLAPIDLDINAVPGDGNLLGNLLCAVAGLLDNGTLGQALNNLLGLVTGLLNGLLGGLPVSGALPAAPVAGAVEGGGAFNGTLTLDNISVNDQNQLVVRGVLSGVVDRGNGLTQRLASVPFTTTATLSHGGTALGPGVCDILTLDLGPLNLNLLGLTIDLAPLDLDINAVPGEGNLLGNLLCAVASLLDPGGALAGLVNQLTSVLGNSLSSLPVSGPLSDGGTFQGLLSVDSFSLDPSGALQVSGLLNGTATTSDNEPYTITNQPFTTLADLASPTPLLPACDILQLDLGPLNLDLLGLTVDLSAIDLDIDAVPGAGNLLGNLLCAVAGLLDGQTPISDLLNNLLGLVNQLLNGLLTNLPILGNLSLPRVEGNVSGGGTFDGDITLQDISLNQANELVVSGLLNGTVQPTSGPARRLTDHPFSTTVDLTSQNSCDILILDLGPLDLDLLGLVVDLAPVELDISAVPGEGNLLGNLLCAVAGLLDSGTPLAGLLGQLTAILGNSLSLLPASGPLSDGGSFNGTTAINSLSLDPSGDLQVSGVLNGVATTSDNQSRQIVNQPFTTTASLTDMVSLGQPICDILQLDLGPLALDLLGLTVDLSAIDLDINAVPGQGNLLGNLLCAVAGLLDPATPVAEGGVSTGTINQLLASASSTLQRQRPPRQQFILLPLMFTRD